MIKNKHKDTTAYLEMSPFEKAFYATALVVMSAGYIDHIARDSRNEILKDESSEAKLSLYEQRAIGNLLEDGGNCSDLSTVSLRNVCHIVNEKAYSVPGPANLGSLSAEP